jgi:Flp pilus assembly protein TadG
MHSFVVSMRRQKGAVAIMVALSMLMLLGVVGLVIDGGLAYMVKARLNAAVDSAALAGARAVTTGSNQADQTASAQAAAAQFFAANIPSNYLLSKPNLLSTTVTFNGGMATIDVRAEAPMPVSVMQVMGFTSLTPTAYAQTIRKDLDMALVVDTSGSLSSSGAAVKTAAKTFLAQFNVLQDRVAMVHFAYGAEIDNAIKTSGRGFDRASMGSNIDKFNFTGSTASVEGMWNARNQLSLISQANRSSLRVIVFFSDGVPNAMGSDLAFKDNSNCPPGVFDSSATGLRSLNDSAGAYLFSTSCRVTDTSWYGSPWSNVSKLPANYNAHPSDTTVFPIVNPNAWRPVTADLSSTSYTFPNGDRSTVGGRNVDSASRNLVEAVAAKARDEGVYVFTLGLGSDLKARSGANNEIGEDLLKCMANVADGPARCYNAAKPVGMYCYAATTANLTPCFSRLASAILRISK